MALYFYYIVPSADFVCSLHRDHGFSSAGLIHQVTMLWCTKSLRDDVSSSREQRYGIILLTSYFECSFSFPLCSETTRAYTRGSSALLALQDTQNCADTTYRRSVSKGKSIQTWLLRGLVSSHFSLPRGDVSSSGEQDYPVVGSHSML